MAATDRETALIRKSAGVRRGRSVAMGVSLIEALVAMAVMAFGMLGVVGMQSTLRFNADVSRQRAEAVRIAQQEIETLRAYNGFTAVDESPSPDVVQFEEIVSDGPNDVPMADEMNTTFSLQTEVTPSPAGAPPQRDVVVTVRWLDRRGDPQQVQLSSQISYYPPELTALPARRGDRGPLARPSGRNPVIPRDAEPYGTGTSAFTPPGAPDGTLWIFNNNTGLIVELCLPTCSAADAILLSGNVAFALTSGEAPDSSDAEAPTSSIPDAFSGAGMRAVRVNASSPGSRTGTVACFMGESLVSPETRLTYYCAIPRPFRGSLEITGVPSLVADPRPVFPTAPGGTEPAPTDATPTKFRLCRYTSAAGNPTTLGSSGIPVPVHNSRHPWHYINADTSYADRNFLVIPAGHVPAIDADPVLNLCPDDNTSTSIQSKTLLHPPPP